jgi:hypothetical protein
MVGITVLISLILLGWMLLKFSDAPFKLFAKAQMPIKLEAPSAEGVSEGTAIYYLGVSVGRVTKIDRSEDLKSVVDGGADRSAGAGQCGGENSHAAVWRRGVDQPGAGAVYGR